MPGTYISPAETSLYYLQSRYYNPTIGRFLSHDSVYDTDAGLQGYNLFAYCGNNPVNRIDISGADSTTINDLDELDDYEQKLKGGGGNSSETPTTPSGPTQSNVGKELLELWDLLVDTFKAGFSGLTGNIPSLGTATSSDAFLPDSYYDTKKAPKQNTPNSTYDNWKYNPWTEEYEYSRVYYDYGGRQVLRVDFTDHGRPDHRNPHFHFYLYDAQYPDGFGIRLP